ncbi:MAG: Neopullulanase 2 [bacterium ADurb.Bin478]|nr:MAG: Neopullulanase 2 [bacterium ADurb.Bin478]
MTYVGSPMIYYGDEAGMWGANDPCCRQPMLWPDQSYAPARFLPDGSIRREAEIVAFDHELHQLYRRLIHLRNRHPALQCGDFQTLLVNDEERIYVFSRSCEEEQIIVALNNSPRGVTCTVKDIDGLLDIWNEGESVSMNSSGGASFEIAPFWARLFAARRSSGEQTTAT